MSLEGLDVTVTELEIDDMVAFRIDHRWTVRAFARGVMHEATGETMGEALSEVASRIKAHQARPFEVHCLCGITYQVLTGTPEAEIPGACPGCGGKAQSRLYPSQGGEA